jgi:hypothetical protein
MKRPTQRRNGARSVVAPSPDLSTTLFAPSRAAVIDAACRGDFMSFGRKCFHQLNPGSAFIPNWHIETIAYHLELVRRGMIKRLIINLPPRGLKSMMSSVSFPAFVLGHDPSKRIIVVSYGEDLAVKLANDFHAIVDSDWYRRLFPWMQVFPRQKHGARGPHHVTRPSSRDFDRWNADRARRRHHHYR